MSRRAIRFSIVAFIVLLGVGPLANSADAPAEAHGGWRSVTYAEVAAALDGLAFDEFVEASYRMWLLRHPQQLTVNGMAEEFGVRNDGLDDYSHEYAQETFAIEREILDRLREFDSATLSEGQRATYAVCEWYWQDEVDGQAYRDYEHLIGMAGPFSFIGYLDYIMAAAHPFFSEDDVVDFLARLQLVGTQLDQIIGQVERKRGLGIIAPQCTLNQALPRIERMIPEESEAHPYYQAFERGIARIEGLSAESIKRYTETALTIIDDIVTPAFGRVYDEMQDLLLVAPEAISIGQFEGGLEAYEYLLRHHTQTDLTAAEIHAIGLREVERTQVEIECYARALGIEDTSTMSAIYDAVAEMTSHVEGQEALDAAERLVRGAEQLLIESGAFSRLPGGELLIIESEYGGFYSPAAKDGSRPAAYMATTGAPFPLYRLPDPTYHEAVPGHHTQSAWAMEVDLPLIRQDVMLTGYVEGWALYAERLMHELGAYQDDPLGNLGRLEFELLRAVRLVADTGIHALGWSLDEASEYVAVTTGVGGEGVDGRVLRYTLIPGQATAYMVGMLEIQKLRSIARCSLGEAFDLAAFHEVILGNGVVPLSFLRDLVDEWAAGCMCTN